VDRYIVFADVDETLIRCKSMVAFLEYVLDPVSSAQPSVLADRRDEIAALMADHARVDDRAALNRRYYALFRGVPEPQLRRAAQSWAEQAMSRGGLFVAATCNELSAHKAAGAELVFVSGSFYEIVEPICAGMGADGVLCTELEIVGGVYTGRLRRQVIGDGKWQVVCRYLEGRGDVSLSRCYAYGDHVSDVGFMERVGHPVVVGDAPDMLAIARQRSWRVLPSA
jgi:HAD superfamily hydrolase (TIGR01490 family)